MKSNNRFHSRLYIICFSGVLMKHLLFFLFVLYLCICICPVASSNFGKKLFCSGIFSIFSLRRDLTLSFLFILRIKGFHFVIIYLFIKEHCIIYILDSVHLLYYYPKVLQFVNFIYVNVTYLHKCVTNIYYIEI